MKKCKEGFPPDRMQLAIVTLLFVLFTAFGASAQTPVRGSLTDKDGKPVVGATVSIKGQKAATSSSDDGTFTIQAKPGDVLVISSIGFEKHEIKFNGKSSVLH